MDISRQIDEIRNKFYESPIRKRLRENAGFPLLLDEEKKKIFVELQDELLIQEQKLLKPLNIVLMGEVKSGKSTLLNAIIDDNVSPTDVLEATAVVLEVGYGIKESAIIYYNDGKSKQGSVDEIFEFLKMNQTDSQFAATVDKVRVMKNKENYKHYNLVDTPGILTITDRNINTTKNYIKWADIILWLMDANYLGQSDVISEIEEIERYGKPIVCILNKMDRIDEPQRIIDYADFNYGMYFESIIPLSASKALNSVLNNDEKLLVESGFKNLLDYLKSYVMDSKELSDEVK